jgi:hypothetical protein
VFGGRVSLLTETRAAVSCEQDFYTYALLADGTPAGSIRAVPTIGS